VEDETGAFDWINPDQVHAFITELLRPIGTLLHGRRLYETMAYWDAPVENYPPEHRDFARVWRRAEKIVFSRTLTGATTRNTRVERDFDLEAIRKLSVWRVFRDESKETVPFSISDCRRSTSQHSHCDNCQESFGNSKPNGQMQIANTREHDRSPVSSRAIAGENSRSVCDPLRLICFRC
jgi:hypothetical protein